VLTSISPLWLMTDILASNRGTSTMIAALSSKSSNSQLDTRPRQQAGVPPESEFHWMAHARPVWRWSIHASNTLDGACWSVSALCSTCVSSPGQHTPRVSSDRQHL